MYRRLSWSQGTVRLRVILGESGTNDDNPAASQALVWMFFLRFFVWQVPVGRVMQMVSESRAQYELIFFLPPLAKLLVEGMEIGWKVTKWEVFNPRMVIPRDPDFCGSNRPCLPVSLQLFGDAEREYMEPFRKETTPAEEKVQPREEPAPQPTRTTAPSQPTWTPRLVVDNGDVPYREPQGVDEVPSWLAGIGDTKSLYDDEEVTDPGTTFLDSPDHLRPKPLQSS